MNGGFCLNLNTSLDESIYRLKILIRQGWLGKVPRGEIESIASHSFAVAMLALILTPIENHLRLSGRSKLSQLDQLKVLELSLVHDFGESQFLDLDKRTMDLLGVEKQRIKNYFESQAALNLRDYFNRFAMLFSFDQGDLPGDKIHTRLIEVLENSTSESQFVHALDKVELNLQCQAYVKNGFLTQIHAKNFLNSSFNYLIAFKNQYCIIPILIEQNIVLNGDV